MLMNIFHNANKITKSNFNLLNHILTKNISHSESRHAHDFDSDDVQMHQCLISL